MVRPYEAVVVLSPALETDEAVDAILTRLQKLITDGGGTVVAVDKWGRRRLAYPLKRFNDGIYVLIQFDAEAAVSRELDRVMRITDTVLRHLIVRRQVQEQAARVGEG